LRFRQLEFFAKLPIKNILSRADQTVPRGVAEPESIFRQHGKGINIKPAIGSALARRQMAVADLIRAGNALCASVGRVVVLVWGKWKTTGQGVDTANVPSAKHSISDAVIQMRMTAAKSYLVIKAQYPAEFLIEVGRPTLRREI